MPLFLTFRLGRAPTAAASLCQAGPARMYRKYPGSVATMPTPSAASSSGECGASARTRGATRPVTSANRRAKKSTCDGSAVHFQEDCNFQSTLGKLLGQTQQPRNCNLCSQGVCVTGQAVLLGMERSSTITPCSL